MSARILLVEDEEHIARGIRFNFEKEGYEVEVRETGGGALARIEQADAPVLDLIVLDVMLPDLSGLQVLEKLRADENRVAVLLLTARDSEENVVAGLDLGADDYLTKPFALPVLLARVRTLLRRAGQTQERTDWHRLTYWAGLAEVVEEFVSKGDRLYVEGRVQYGSYERADGIEIPTVEIHVTELVMLGSAGQSESDGDDGEVPF